MNNKDTLHIKHYTKGTLCAYSLLYGALYAFICYYLLLYICCRPPLLHMHIPAGRHSFTCIKPLQAVTRLYVSNRCRPPLGVLREGGASEQEPRHFRRHGGPNRDLAHEGRALEGALVRIACSGITHHLTRVLAQRKHTVARVRLAHNPITWRALTKCMRWSI